MLQNKFMMVMVLCFIFGGFFVISFVSEASISLNRPQGKGIPKFDRINGNFTDDFTLNRTVLGRQVTGNPLSSNALVDLLSGIVFIIAGLAIWYSIKEKETKKIEENVVHKYLTSDEKKVMNELKEAKGELTQKEIMVKTGFSKSKIHRVLIKLENRDIIERHPFGMTKKVVIKKK